MTNDSSNRYSLTQLPGGYAICRMAPNTPIPAWLNTSEIAASGFISITRTPDELSIICAEAVLPTSPDSDMTIARDWVLLRVDGPFAFDVTGVIAALSLPLAQADVVILALATFDTDYLLVKAEQLPQAVNALTQAGHSVTI